MLKIRELYKLSLRILTVIGIFLFVGSHLVLAEDQSLKALHGRYKQASDQTKRIQALLEISKKEPKTAEDAEELRAIFSRKEHDGDLFEAAVESVKMIRNPSLDTVLIDILKDEKPFVEKAARKDFQGKSEKEAIRRGTSIMFVIAKLGEMKSKNAVSILKEYLDSPNFQYGASQALARIGDTTASEHLRDKAYKGEDVNFAGQGSEEALSIVRDLEDKSKKDKWPKIAKQIIHIRDPKAKPYLKRLFDHEESYVRWEAAAKFRSLADESDVPTILEMTKNRDDIIRTEAIHAMKKMKNIEFADELIALLKDRDYLVRLSAAKALGYKKITKAVPSLEKAIKDSEAREDEILKRDFGSADGEINVREEVYIALYILTGKKYDYKGKRASIEFQAELQKEHPTFY